MNATDALAEVWSALATYTAANNGRLAMARDPFEPLEILSESPAGFLVILVDEGEDVEGGFPVQLLAPKWAVYVSHHRGLPVSEKAHIIGPAPDSRVPLLDRCDGTRDAVLAINFSATQSTVNAQYQGRQPVVTPNGMPLQAYILRFQLYTDAT